MDSLLNEAANEALTRYNLNKPTPLKYWAVQVAREYRLDLGVVLGACGKKVLRNKYITDKGKRLRNPWKGYDN